MIQRINIADDISIVFSFQDCGYADVLSTFDNAEWIDIVTYHLSQKESELFDAIRNANNAIEMRLVTNLPDHWDEYWGLGPKRRFREQLAKYRSMLDPTIVGELASFFNVSNHSKIVMTDKIAYIGSSNYSSESKNNYECGVLFSSPKVIASIRSEIVDYLIENSAPRDLTVIGATKLSIQDIHNRLKTLMMSLAEGFFEELEEGGKSARVFRWDDAEVSEEELKRFADFLDGWRSLHEEFEEHAQLRGIADMVDLRLSDQMRDIVENEDGPLFKLARFNYDDAVNRQWQEYARSAYDELVDRFMECANDDALEERRALVETARNALKQLRDLVIAMLDQTKAILDKLQELEETKWGVDNT